MRTESESWGGVNRNIDTYYGFGMYEKKLLQKKGIKIKKYIGSGSLRNEIYKKKFIEEGGKKTDICYISDFGNGKTADLKALKRHSIDVFLSLIGYCEASGYSLSVALRSELNSDGYQSEVDFYCNLDCNRIAKLLPNNTSKFRSYNTAFNSDVVVCTFSTLGFEMLGVKKKVLFAIGLNNSELMQLFDSFMMHKELPDDIIVRDIEDFHNKIDNLLSCDYKKYIEITKNARLYSMNQDVNPPIDSLIKNEISSYLNNYSLFNK